MSLLELLVDSLVTTPPETRVEVALIAGVSLSFLQDVIQGHVEPDDALAGRILAAVAPKLAMVG